MDWQHLRFDWNQARAFLAAAEEGSFSAAARALGLTQPTVGRQVAALEVELGTALFDRVGKRLHITPTGVELLEHARAMGAGATGLQRAAAGHSASLEGPVCISASESLAGFLLPAVVAELGRTHPGIRIELLATYASSDLRRREADLALRHYRPRDPELVARKVGELQAHLYVARANATDGTLDGLAGGRFIRFEQDDTLLDTLEQLGLSLSPEQFPLVTRSELVQWELIKAGAGIGLVPCFVGDAEPSVVRALPNHPPLQVPVWLTSHHELRTSRRLRTVADRIAQAVRDIGSRAPVGG